MKEEKSIKSLVLRVLFIVAIVIVVVILAFAIIKVIPYALSSFASMGNMFSSSSKNEIKISASNANLLDGERFLLSWNHRTDKIGEYKLTYKCIENFKISAVTENGIQTILCNTRYSLPNNKNNIELEVQLDKINSFSDVSLEILFIETQTQNIEAKGNLTITVRNDSNIPIGENAATNITTEPITENQVNNQNQATSNQQSSQISPAPQIRLADLAISNPVILNNRTIQFSISNIGGTSVGNWFFTYSIPGQRVEMSPVQPPLLP
ncbi:MAG TPA: hypothetical protein PKE08_00505, partial [Candidatus Paceibacterota bacterium]|nr:hypothetical protein [Candidatus Paceibacterota bacterium]